MRGEQFQHDLLQEAVQANMGVFIKKFLHRKCAGFLEGHGDPARVAQHWIEGNEETRAVPHLFLAAEHSKEQFQIQKTCALYRQAGLVLERFGQRNQAFEAFEQAREVLFTHDLGEEIQVVVNDMKRVAKSLEERVKVAHVQAELLTDRQEFATATKIAKHGLELARALGNDVYLSDLEGDLGLLHFYQGQFHEAIAYLERALVYAERHLKCVETEANADTFKAARLLVAVSTTNLASTLDHVGQYQQAEQYHRQTIELLRVLGEQQQMLAALSNFAINLMDQGRFTQAREIIEEALGMLEYREDGGGLHVIPLLAAVVDVYLALDEAWLALPQALKAVSQAESLDDPRLPLLQIRLALVWHTLGETERAREMFDAALHSPNQHPVFASRIVRTYATFLHDLEEDTDALQTNLEAVLEEETSTVRTMQIGLLFARLKDPATRHDYAQKTLEQALERGMNGIVIAGHSRLGAALLELQQPHQALEQTRHAMTLLEQFGSEIPKIEVLWTHYRALLANDQTLEASAHLATTWQHLESIKLGLPLEYQQGFLQHNTVNRAILKEAREAGLAQ
jgi:tetratricopeptide (TPR) repeat protein